MGDSMNLEMYASATIMNPMTAPNDTNQPNLEHGIPRQSKVQFSTPPPALTSTKIENRPTSTKLRPTLLSEYFVPEVVEDVNVLLTSPYLLMKKPLAVFCLAILFAWIYLIIPNGDYWQYNILKSSIWIVSGTVWAVETMEACYPDTADWTYVLAYLAGFLSPVLFFTFGYFSPETRGSFVFNVFAISGVVFWTPLIFLIDIWFRQPIALTRDIVEHNFSDLFVAALDPDESLNQEDTGDVMQSLSQARIEYYEELKALGEAPVNPNPVLEGVARVCWFLPRFVHRASGKPPTVLVGETSSTVQVLLGLLFSVLYIFNFYFLMFFTIFFRSASIHGGALYTLAARFLQLVVFVLVNTGFRLAMKRVGIVLDQRKKHGISIFFIAETICLMFYYTFYRVLFESVHSWALFAAMLVLHLGFEWISYPLRGSHFFYSFIVHLKSQRFGFLIPDLVQSKDLNSLDWQLFLSLDFAIRVWVMVFSSLGMLLIFLTIDLAPWISNELRETNLEAFGVTAGFILLATMFEIINAVAIVRVFFLPNRLSLVSAANKCFSDVRFAVLVSAIVLVCFLNPISVFNLL